MRRPIDDPVLVELLRANPVDAVRRAGRAAHKAYRHRSALRDVLGDLLALIRLIRAWAGGRYGTVPWRTLVMASGAVLYFVNPLDMVPDQLFAVGYLDDAWVIAMVAATVRADLERFVDWERRREAPHAAPA